MTQAETDVLVQECRGCGGDIKQDGQGQWGATWYPVEDAYRCPESPSGFHEPGERAGDDRG